MQQQSGGMLSGQFVIYMGEKLALFYCQQNYCEGLGGMIVQGMAMGAGSAVGRRAVDSGN